MFMVVTSKQALLFRQLQIDWLGHQKYAKFDTNTGSNFTLFT
jgi:hypothetical protein